MKMKKNNRSQYNINGPMDHGCKYSQYKTCLSMMMLICIKQLRSSIWSSIHEKVKQHWRWVEKKMFQFKPFKQFKKCPYVSKCSCVHKWHSSMGVFHVFKNVQMVPNRTKHHKSSQRYDSVRLHVSSLFLHRTRRDYYILLVANCQQISN